MTTLLPCSISDVKFSKIEGNEGNFRHRELKFSNSVPTAPVFLFPAPTGRLTIPCGRSGGLKVETITPVGVKYNKLILIVFTPLNLQLF